MSILCEPFASMSSAEAERFMAGNKHPIREAAAQAVGDRQVLDLGCGRGIRICELYKPDQYRGIDCSAELIRVARRDNPGYSFATADILQFLALVPDKSVEVVLMVSVFEHLPSLELAQRIYSESRRVSEELLVGWHTPPHYSQTRILQVQAELDRPIWQNQYKEGSFDGAVQIGKVQLAELWTVRG